ncbi:lipase class 3 family [Chlorella sorokiniana]|uniref:Lipase class 3 family n=1 Tax=Chlorella sorokiniana TaxID=3076 RepID=A0A2P6TI22_CHLSO|nr:lipase class 3 family [Chlorella sorokiniana]|eukprot:PRW33942.1 lipase class 3 family [Chlorella sorokiniana]
MPAGRRGPALPWQSSGEQPGQPAEDRSLLDATGCQTVEELQDLLSCLLLSEAVYKAAEGPPAAAAAALNSLRAELPPGLAPLLSVQYSRRSTEHRHLLARSATTLYVAFMGSKHPRDYLADANLLTRLLWSETAPAGGSTGSDRIEQPGRSSSVGAGTAAASAAPGAPAESAAPSAAPAVHRGFLSRAEGVLIEALWAHAQRQGLRLVLCGHSLGGAVAQLCTLRLLHALRSALTPPAALRCIVFGAPPIGNAALAERVQREGWEPHFLRMALPEDPVPRLLLQPASPAAAPEAAANQDALAAAEAQEQAAEVAGQAAEEAAAAYGAAQQQAWERQQQLALLARL